MARYRRILVLVVAACTLSAAAPAEAAFPGANGKINFRTSSGAYFINGDGSGLTPAPVLGIWSPDASKVVYECTGGYYCVHQADGSGGMDFPAGASEIHGISWSPDGSKIVHGGQACGASYCDPAEVAYDGYPSGPRGFVSGQDDVSPVWSPDGRKIAFVTYRHDHRSIDPFTAGCFPCNTEIYTSNVDGTGQLRITNDSGAEAFSANYFPPDDARWLPSWSPDGTRIAFMSTRDDPNPSRCSPCSTEVYVINVDGTGILRLTNSPGNSLKPVWSPDGTKIAFETTRDGNAEIYTMNPDGSGQTNITNSTANETLYDWLTIPIAAYPRPRGATPLRISLVPAYTPCTTPNTTHGTPLAFGSCNPPTQASSQLTLGTPDANGKGANSQASVLYGVVPGNSTPPDDADVGVVVSISDVRKRSDLTDYTGQLQLSSGLRITDKDNTPAPGGPSAGTAQDGALPVTVSCTPTPAATTGSNCNLSTSFDALYPGIAKEGMRAIWQLGQMKVYDGGADGLASTQGDNTLFMTQGVFIP